MATFPSSIIGFTTKATGDIIQATDVNTPQDEITALETKVGVDSSAVTTSLDYKVKNSSSVDPGHLHTFASGVTGTIPVNRGGTNTTSYTKGDILIASAAATLTKLAIGGNDTVLTAASGETTGVKWSAPTVKFGGTGTDGALTATSGTTTLDLSSASYYEKNYTSISLTGTAKLAFSNPHASGTIVVIKSQGNVTLTSGATIIDCSGLGANGGAGGASVTAAGSNGSTPNSNLVYMSDSFGKGGAGSGGGGSVAVGTYIANILHSNIIGRTIPLTCGAGGGGGGAGSAGSNAGATGGKGGGALYIECGGAWNFTTANGISVGGAVGGNGNAGNQGGGGGGGGGGTCIILYTSLTNNDGTIVVTGGAGGSPAASPDGSGGSGGASPINNGAAQSGGTGGSGGTGKSIVSLNNWF